MAVGTPTNFFHLKGRLVAGSSLDLSAAYPHSGTELGEVKAGTWIDSTAHVAIEAEEFAGAEAGWVRRGQVGVLTATLREFDSSALALIYPNVSASTATGKTVIQSRAFGSSLTLPGSDAADKATVFLFTPDSPKHVPAILMYNAVPLPEAQSAMQMSLSTSGGFPFVLKCPHNSAGKNFDVGLLSDLPTNP